MKRILTVKTRLGTGKYFAAKLRKEGRIPGMLYGHELLKTPLTPVERKLTKREKADYPHTRGTTVTIGQKDLEKEIRERGAAITNTLYNIIVDGEEEPMQVILRDLQIHALQRYPTHVNYERYCPKKGTKVEIPIYYSGQETLTGYVHKTLSFLPCKVVGDHIPSSIEVNLANMVVGDQILLDDVVLPENVRIFRHKRIKDMDKIMVATILGKRETGFDPRHQEVSK